ncbi:MAG: Cell division protein FtsA [bacterium ADurb.Bin429]|nr:MAG: Cell division protein FtsA [bacterium ADurb.Bin429]
MAMLGKFAAGGGTIGIDIGSHSIKVVQLSPSRTGFALTRAGSTPTPPNAIKQGVVTDRPAVADAVHLLMRDLGIGAGAAIAAVAGPTVVVRQVQLPAMPEAHLRKSIYWEARNYISFPVENSLLEFQILETHTDESTPKMDVMLVAAPRELVDSRVETLEQAGVELLAVEVEPFSLMRAAIELPRGGTAVTNDTIALVDIGATYTSISIVSNGAFVLSRTITIAGFNFTEAIMNVLGVDVLQAEEIKENELQVVTDEVSRAELSPIGQEASRALEPVLEELVREIRRSFAFYDYQQGPGGTPRAAGAVGVSRVILTGGSAKMTGLAPFLQEQLSLPVGITDIFSKGMVQVPEGADELYAQEPMLATATGLALREPMLVREKGGYR